MKINDYIPHSHVGIIFELEFRVEIGKGGGIYSVCIGFQFFMPEMTSQGVPTDQQFTIPLLKGPIETIDNELCVAEEALVNQHENLLEFVLTGYMSAKDTRPFGSDAAAFPSTWTAPPAMPARQNPPPRAPAGRAPSNSIMGGSSGASASNNREMEGLKKQMDDMQRAHQMALDRQSQQMAMGSGQATGGSFSQNPLADD